MLGRTAKTGNWKPLYPAIMALVAALPEPVELPIAVKVTGRKGGRYGAHALRPVYTAPPGVLAQLPRGTMFYHHITVKNWVSQEQAESTLRHELVHVLQVERVMRMTEGSLPDKAFAWYAFQAEQHKIDYEKRPIEVEARELAAQWLKSFPVGLTGQERILTR